MNGVIERLLPSAGGLGVLGRYLGLNLLLGGGIAHRDIGLAGYVSGASVANVAGGAIISVARLGGGIPRRWYHGWPHGIRGIQQDMESALSVASERWLLNRFWFDYRGEINGDSWYGVSAAVILLPITVLVPGVRLWKRK